MMKRLAAAVFLLALSCGAACASTCYVTEFPLTADAGVQVARQPALINQTVTVSGVSAQSAAFGGDTKLIRVHCDGIVSLLVGANPTATTAMMRMTADQTEYFQVLPGQKIAFITNT
jgi:hypothetical protein